MFIQVISFPMSMEKRVVPSLDTKAQELVRVNDHFSYLVIFPLITSINLLRANIFEELASHL